MYKIGKYSTISVGSLFMLSLILLLVACSSSQPKPTSTPAPNTGAVSFKNDVVPIFNSSCVVCHQGAKPPAGLSLEPGIAYQNLVNAPSTESTLARVAPGAPEKSYIVNKLLGTQAQAGGKGALMPYNAQPLPEAQINSIQQWIKAGASNN